ncbi:MAG: RIP metalloprotease RseP [Methylotenera sp.]|nr:RIP metalloprotease RseP [Methylotenera sp.]
MTTLIAFIITIGILVTIHEYGHFQVARWCNVKVLRFSIGFGKPLWKKTFGHDKTEFVLAAIPLGGFVKMLDERELKAERESAIENGQYAEQLIYSEAELKRAFNRQNVWKRIAIVLAGPVANLLLAILLYWVLLMQGVTGMRPIIGEVAVNSLAATAGFKSGETIQKVAGVSVKTWPDARWILLEQSLESKSVQIETLNDMNDLNTRMLSFDGIDSDPEIDILNKVGLEMIKPILPAILGEILPDSAAKKSNFQANDKILSIDNVKVRDWETVVNTVKANPNQLLQFKIARAQQILTISVTPEQVTQNGEKIGRLGASVKIDQVTLDKLLIKLKYSPFEALQKAIFKTWDTSIFSLKMLGRMLTGEVSIKGISGPVTIATFAGESANLGLSTFLSFLALVSISIGVLNLLPIPVLDGGHLMYYIVEIFKGSPVSDQTMLAGQKIGFVLLGLLMTIAIFNDFNRLITG